MTQPGEQRPVGAASPSPAGTRGDSTLERLRPRSTGAAIGQALLVALLVAVAWGLLKGILEIGIGLLLLALLGGWLIGAVLRPVPRAPWLAVAVAALAWLAGLLFTWMIAMALLPASSRTFIERLQGTPFTDWLSPQFGLVEVVAVLLYVAAAAYGARPRR
jgi:hypothetical protein